jgi:hypothetical protein
VMQAYWVTYKRILVLIKYDILYIILERSVIFIPRTMRFTHNWFHINVNDTHKKQWKLFAATAFTQRYY